MQTCTGRSRTGCGNCIIGDVFSVKDVRKWGWFLVLEMQNQNRTCWHQISHLYAMRKKRSIALEEVRSDSTLIWPRYWSVGALWCKYTPTIHHHFSSDWKVNFRYVANCVVGCSTVLQARRSHVRFLMRYLVFFNLLTPSNRTMALRSTQPLTEISTRNLSGG
jgi:hypothetical protein